uniref:(northern house mosquito) hypothetical protein n=1 Tax=Culex pipiens TaxID=7175 RepID=A0A8D8GXU5_CULPI
MPREMMSAGFSIPGTWSQDPLSVRCWISDTRLATNWFHLDGSDASQQRTIMESVQKNALPRKLMALATFSYRCASSRADASSRRGIDCLRFFFFRFSSGAMRDLEASKRTVTSPLAETVRM